MWNLQESTKLYTVLLLERQEMDNIHWAFVEKNLAEI